MRLCGIHTGVRDPNTHEQQCTLNMYRGLDRAYIDFYPNMCVVHIPNKPQVYLHNLCKQTD